MLTLMLAVLAALATLFTPAAIAVRGVHYQAPEAVAHMAMHHHNAATHVQHRHKHSQGPQDMACAGCMAMAAQPIGTIAPSAVSRKPDGTPEAVFDDLRALPPLPPPRV